MMDNENGNTGTPEEMENVNAAASEPETAVPAQTGDTADGAPAPQEAAPQEAQAAAPEETAAPYEPETAVPAQTGDTADGAPMPQEITAAMPQEMLPAFPAEPAPKKNRLPLIIGAVVVALVAVGTAVALLLTGSPERAVKDAFRNTAQDQRKLNEQVRADIPALGADIQGKPVRYDYDLSLEGVEGIDLPASVGSLLRGFGLHGYITSLPQQDTQEVETGVRFGTADILSLYVYTSPETVALGVPAFSETMLAAHPATLAEELQQSPFADSFTTGEVEQLQQQLQSQSRLSGLDTVAVSEELSKKLASIVEQQMPNIAFQKGDKVDGKQTYRITAPGEEVKAALVESMRYLLTESSLKDAYRAAFEPTALNMGMEYEQLTAILMERLEKDISPQALTAVVTVDGGKVVKLEAALAAANEPNPEFDIFYFNVTCEFNSGVGAVADIAMSMSVDGSPLIFTASAETARDPDKSYLEKVSMDVQTKELLLGLDYSSDYRPDGGVTQGFGLELNNNGTKLDMGLDAEGTVTKGTDGTLLTYDFPQVSMNFGDGYSRYTARFTANMTATSVGEELQPARAFTYVAEMTDDEAQTVKDAYSEGLMALLGILFGMPM